MLRKWPYNKDDDGDSDNGADSDNEGGYGEDGDEDDDGDAGDDGGDDEFRSEGDDDDVNQTRLQLWKLRPQSHILITRPAKPWTPISPGLLPCVFLTHMLKISRGGGFG